jgi:hypothetical protein
MELKEEKEPKPAKRERSVGKAVKKKKKTST